MDIVNMIKAVGYSGDDKTAGNQAQGIQLKGTILHRDISAVEVGRNLCRLLGFGARLLGAYLIQQPTENQSYKQPFGQRKWFFLKCRNGSFIVCHQSSSANKALISSAIEPISKPPSLSLGHNSLGLSQ